MKGEEFNPKNTKGSLRERFDSYCKRVIYHAAYNTVHKQERYLFYQWSGEGAELEKMQEVIEDDIGAVKLSVRGYDVTLHDPDLAELVMELQARKREIFLLNEIIGMSLTEIATELGVEYETVKSTKSKAMRDLRKGAARKNGKKD